MLSRALPVLLEGPRAKMDPEFAFPDGQVSLGRFGAAKGIKRARAEDEDAADGAVGNSGGPAGDGRFLSLKAPVFRITATRRLYNTITEGEFFFPMYMYLTPYLMALKSTGNNTYGATNQVVDYLISAATPLFHQATHFKTMMKISHITSNIQTAAGAAEVDTVAGNNSPYLNIGRDSINLFKNASCIATPTPSTWSESALRANNVYAVMHNGGIYESNLEAGNTIGLQDFGTQGPYSMFSDIKTLQSGTKSNYTIRNNYHAPDGHAFVVPSTKAALGVVVNTTLPLCVVRCPFPSAQMSAINSNASGTGNNPPSFSEPVLRDENNIANINLNSGGEAVCLWVNPLNPDRSAAATTAQKLQISFMMELTCDIDVKINYTSRGPPTSPTLYNDGDGTGGKVVALPSQAVPTANQNNYWIYGDALRSTHRNQL